MAGAAADVYTLYIWYTTMQRFAFFSTTPPLMMPDDFLCLRFADDTFCFLRYDAAVTLRPPAPLPPASQALAADISAYMLMPPCC